MTRSSRKAVRIKKTTLKDLEAYKKAVTLAQELSKNAKPHAGRILRAERLSHFPDLMGRQRRLDYADLGYSPAISKNLERIANLLSPPVHPFMMERIRSSHRDGGEYLEGTRALLVKEIESRRTLPTEVKRLYRRAIKQQFASFQRTNAYVGHVIQPEPTEPDADLAEALPFTKKDSSEWN